MWATQLPITSSTILGMIRYHANNVNTVQVAQHPSSRAQIGLDD